MSNLTPENKMIKEITSLIIRSREEVNRQVNISLITTYWNVGKIIASNENEYNNRLEYGKEVIKQLSNELTKYVGKGFSYTNLKYMRMFYKSYPDFENLNENISWSHYLELMIISDKDKRGFYEKEIVNNKWGVRELKRQYML